MSNRKNVHIVQRDSGWGTLREGGQRATEVFDTQAQAIQAGREMARQGQGELLIHGENGRISARDSYGNDPYLEQYGKPKKVAELANHRLIGNSQLASLNQWPLRSLQGDSHAITPTLSASSGETMRQLALAGLGIVCLADFMTATDCERGALVQVLTRDTVEVRQAVNAVYYRNTALSSRITAFLDFLTASLKPAM